MASLQVTGLTVVAGEPARDVLRDITVAFDPGTITLIVGANGSGKSMLLRALLGLVRAHDGTIALDGEEIRRGFHRVHERAGVCFQNPDLQIFGETVREDVALGVDSSGAAVDDAALDALLARFALDECRDAAPWELSGGQKRRVALAGAFAGDPALLILDEPFLELDYPSIRILTSLLRDRRDEGACILVTSHDTVDIWEIVDRVIVLDAGCVVFAGERDAAVRFIGPEVGLRPVRTDVETDGI